MKLNDLEDEMTSGSQAVKAATIRRMQCFSQQVSPPTTVSAVVSPQFFSGIAVRTWQFEPLQLLYHRRTKVRLRKRKKDELGRGVRVAG